MKKKTKVKSKEKEENINHHPAYYIIKDEVFEELKASVKELLESRRRDERNKLQGIKQSNN